MKKRTAIILILVIASVLLGIIIVSMANYIYGYKPMWSFMSLDAAIVTVSIATVLFLLSITGIILSIIRIRKLYIEKSSGKKNKINRNADK